jgi:acrylyl-CoA reductase (NADPH)
LANANTAWWVSGDGSGRLTTHFRTDIPDRELGRDLVTIALEYSAVNYKDALALTGKPGVLRQTPLVPGIDASGVVSHSESPEFPVGTPVIVTGFGYGETRHGGLATTLSAHPDHLIALPEGLTTLQAATLGTAGLTALLALHALTRNGLSPENPLPLAITGAAGAVGSLAVFLAQRYGFAVTAITGRTTEADYLTSLGATTVVSRQEVLSTPKRPLLPETYSGVIDQAGGSMLATLLASTESNGTVVACGLAGGTEVPTTVLPFILRGITLVGINSVYQPPSVRKALWKEFAALAPTIPWDDIRVIVPLAEALNSAERVLSGLSRGRVVVSASL